MFIDEAKLSMGMNNSNIEQVFDGAMAPDGICYKASSPRSRGARAHAHGHVEPASLSSDRMAFRWRTRA
jgi:hypothetical protein